MANLFGNRYLKYRTGTAQKCRCKLQPFPYELRGLTAKTANDAAVLRDAFRKHNHSVRTGFCFDDGSWDLPLSFDGSESPRPRAPDLINRLPTEVLGQILLEVYKSTETSNDICTCSRPKTPYEIVKSRSLIHRVVDTFAIRLTCSRWHNWALKSILSGLIEGSEHIELDISNLDVFTKHMQLPPGTVGVRLARDFPFLAWSGITLYLGNPGEISNLILVVQMLMQEKAHGGGDYQIFRGVSFWDLSYIFREIASQAPWHAHDLLLLDIISHFSEMPVATRVQFPATILSTLPQEYWELVLEGLLRHSDRLSMREFLTVNHAPNTPRRGRLRNNSSNKSLPLIPTGNYLDLPEHFKRRQSAVPIDIDRHCFKLHSNACLGTQEHWGHLRHLNLALKSSSGTGIQNWRIDDAFLAKLGCYNLNKLVSVQIDGGLASHLTIDGLLHLLEPSYRTLEKLIFRPDVGNPDIRQSRNVENKKHHCQVLSSLDFEKTFPRLKELELHLPCCPDIFRSNGHQAWKSSLKRHWRFEIKQHHALFMPFCQDWINRTGLSNWPFFWTRGHLSILFESARAARKSLLSREIREAEAIQSAINEITAKRNEKLGSEHYWRTQDREIKEMQKALANKWKEVTEKWQVDIYMENVKIRGFTNRALTNLTFHPLEVPPKVSIQITTLVQGDRVFREEVVESELDEETFLKELGEAPIEYGNLWR